MLSDVLKRNPPSVTSRATAKNISKIDIVPPNYQDCTDLFLSHNSISNLKNITQFRSLQRLMVEYNVIEFIDDLEPLEKLKNIKELKIEGNPVCRHPFYEYHIIFLCPTLEILNGKRIKRDEDSKFALYENEITKALYYSTIISKSIQLQNRNPPLTNDKISETLMKEMIKFKLTDFRRKFAKDGPKDVDSYKKYIQQQCVKLESNIQARFTPKFPKKFQDNHKKNLVLIQNSKDLGELTKAMHRQLSNDLNLVGFQTNDEYTQSIKDKANDNKYTKNVCDEWTKIAKEYRDEDYIEKEKEKITVKPKKKEVVTKKAKDLFAFPNKRRKDTFRGMQHTIRKTITDDPELKAKLEEKIRKEMMDTIRLNRPSLIIDPKSTIAFTLNLVKPKPIIQESDPQVIINSPQQDIITIIEPEEKKKNFAIIKRPREHSMNKHKKDNDDDSDVAERMELNFEAQLKKELDEQKSSASQRDNFSDGSFDESLSVGPPAKPRPDINYDRLILSDQAWPSSRPPKVPKPSSREAMRFSQQDWEVKLFIEKREKSIEKKVLKAWMMNTNHRNKLSKSRNPRRNSTSTLPFPDLQSDGIFVGDQFLSEFLSSQPEKRMRKNRRSSFHGSNSIPPSPHNRPSSLVQNY